MKHKGNISDFTFMRNRELMCAFRNVYKEIHRFDISTDFELVVNQPCSRFWISEERATAVISAMLRGQPVLDGMRHTKREMFVEIFKRVNQEIDKNPDTPLCEIVFNVVNSPAPKFYMKPRHAREILYKIRNGHYVYHPHYNMNMECPR